MSINNLQYEIVGYKMEKDNFFFRDSQGFNVENGKTDHEGIELNYILKIEKEHPIIFTSRRSSELIKYASNSMLAMRIIFINEIADLCEKVGANVEDIANGIGLDKRIGPHFLNAGPGFGGSCFPKDARALIESGEEYNAPQNLLKAVIDGNEKRKLNLGNRILEIIGENKKVGILGVTFKANTDDISNLRWL